MSIKTVVAIGIGAAMFFVLGRFVVLPSGIPNTNLSLQYAVLGLFAVMYGPVAGALIGFLGHTLIDLSWGGSPWWSWIIASAVAGLIMGMIAEKVKLSEGNFGKKEIITYVVTTAVSQIVSFVVLAPVLDILIYAEPANKVFVQGAVAAGLNFLVAAILGGLLLFAYSKTIAKKGSLNKE
ncbi:MAG: ECF-type riboflavin transporter substrate-binding protein [Ruthenibacterium sp.]